MFLNAIFRSMDISKEQDYHHLNEYVQEILTQSKEQFIREIVLEPLSTFVFKMDFFICKICRN